MFWIQSNLFKVKSLASLFNHLHCSSLCTHAQRKHKQNINIFYRSHWLQSRNYYSYIRLKHRHRHLLLFSLVSINKFNKNLFISQRATCFYFDFLAGKYWFSRMRLGRNMFYRSFMMVSQFHSS